MIGLLDIVGIDDLQAFIDQHLADYVGPADIVFAGGSLVEGYGNRTSDIDLVIFNQGRTAHAHADVAVAMDNYSILDLRLGGRRVDVEIRDLEDAKRMAASLAADVANGSISAHRFSQADLELFNDIVCGIPLRGGEQLVEIRRLASTDAVSRQACEYFNALADSLIEDAVGATDARDAGAAMISSRAALGRAADCLTAAYGATNPKPKWRVRRLEAAGLAQELRQYLEAECLAGVDDDSMIGAARVRVSLSRSFVSKAHLKLMERQFGE